MKTYLVALTLLVIALGLYTPALAETIFDSSNYLGGEAGVIGPIDQGADMNAPVTVPISVWLGDRDNFYRFSVEKSTNLSGSLPDFERDYINGEAGILGPIE